MARDAAMAADLLAADDIWHPAAMMLVAVAAVILGSESADDEIDRAIEAYHRHGSTHIAGATAYAMRASRALERGDAHAATESLARARRVLRDHGLAEMVLTGLLDALAARLALRHGGAAQARSDLIHAQRFRPQLTRAVPWLSIMTRLEMATAMLGLDDPGGARFLLQEIRELRDPAVDIGGFATRIEALEAALHHRDGAVSPSTLSAAELRLLPLLTTHLTFREIAAHLFLSSNTVKTQAISIYRKLDATSRTQAVERATSLGLIDGGPTAATGHSA
jgi:LuxR family maltose regulon positive regulatory protein